MSNLMKGVQYMHAKEIIHRDLKLENILLPNPNSLDVLIADFGLAASFPQKSMFKKCGTPGYIAPEILNLGVYSEKVDIFSAGVICYIL